VAGRRDGCQRSGRKRQTDLGLTGAECLLVRTRSVDGTHAVASEPTDRAADVIPGERLPQCVIVESV